MTAQSRAVRRRRLISVRVSIRGYPLNVLGKSRVLARRFLITQMGGARGASPPKQPVFFLEELEGRAYSVASLERRSFAAWMLKGLLPPPILTNSERYFLALALSPRLAKAMPACSRASTFSLRAWIAFR